jgi:hypothetical protein
MQMPQNRRMLCAVFQSRTQKLELYTYKNQRHRQVALDDEYDMIRGDVLVCLWDISTVIFGTKDSAWWEIRILFPFTYSCRFDECQVLSKNLCFCCRLSTAPAWFQLAAGNLWGSSCRGSSAPLSRALHLSICRQVLIFLLQFLAYRPSFSVLNPTPFILLHSLRGLGIFLSPPRQERLWGLPSLLSNGYQGFFP